MSGGSRLRAAIAALRAGRPVGIEGTQPLTVLAVETATQEMLDLLDPKAAARLLISGQRAAALMLA
ncbi:MAG TPA: GTP cyclohydrolase II, partial [Sphingomicrobium sp.]